MAKYMKHYRKVRNIFERFTQGDVQDDDVVETNSMLIESDNEISIELADDIFVDEAHAMDNFEMDSYEEEMETVDTELYSNVDCLSENFGEEDNQENMGGTVDPKQKELAIWATRYKISHASLRSLLQLLKQWIPEEEFPRDPRSLLGTATKYTVKELCGGTYFYFGIESGIVRELDRYSNLVGSQIVLKVNIDSLPIFPKSNKDEFTTILGLLPLCNTKPLLIAIFLGNGLPSDANEFLRDFVEEAQYLHQNGLEYKNNILSFRISGIICDTVARHFIKGTKGHGGYSSCDRCMIDGTYLVNKVVFLTTGHRSRTDRNFRLMLDEDHHNNHSILTEIKYLDMVHDFPLDYMHLVLLGAVKKFLLNLKSGPLLCRLQTRLVQEISRKLESFKKWSPKEMARKPRSLEFLAFYKATEFRQFVLYTGIVALRNIIEDCMYQHFLLLVCSMRILLNDSLAVEQNDCAREMLKVYVEHYSQLYTEASMTYNIHSLVHLADDAVYYKCSLDKLSAFPFESYLHTVKTYIRKPSNTIAQVIRRVSEEHCIPVENSELELRKEHRDGPLEENLDGCRQFKELIHNNQVISVSRPDSCILYGDKVYIVCNILYRNEVKLLAKSFRITQNLFSYPLPSKQFGIYKVSILNDELHVLNPYQVKKCVLLPLSESQTFNSGTFAAIRFVDK